MDCATLLDTMRPVNALLRLTLIFSSTAGLLQPTELVPDWECFNDYDTEMVCSFSSGNNQPCSEYRLTVINDLEAERTVHQCIFENASVGLSLCQCKLLLPGFVIKETYDVKLWRGLTYLSSKNICTEDIIKPKRPINLTVEQTENGNFLISWGTNYTSDKKAFTECLTTELLFIVKGIENQSIPVDKGLTKYDIVGRNLKPNSDYVVMARTSTDYNNNEIFSYYSDPVEFSTGSSLKNTLAIVISTLCVILIISICTLFYCYTKIVKQWWDKIPIPEMTNFLKPPIQPLTPDKNEFSTVYAYPSILYPVKDKTWKSPDSFGNSLNSIGKSDDYDGVAYAQTGPGDMQCEPPEDYKSVDCVKLEKAKIDEQREFGNDSGSSFSNKCYLGSDTSSSSFLKESITHLAYPSNESDNPFHLNKDPVIPTDFDYGPCKGCSGLESTPCSTKTDFSLDYQKVTTLLSPSNKLYDQGFISFHNDKTVPRSPLDVALLSGEGVVISVDDGYQSLPSLIQNTAQSSDNSSEFEPNISQTVAQTAPHNMNSITQQIHASSIKSLCGPALNISPGIQIDCSYQRV